MSTLDPGARRSHVLSCSCPVLQALLLLCVLIIIIIIISLPVPLPLPLCVSVLSRLLEVLDRSKEFVDEEGVPHDVQILLVKLEDSIMEMSNDVYRSLAKPDARARNTIKHAISTY